jgi:hypothetical protein
MTLDYGYGPCGLGGYIWEKGKIVMFTPDPERKEKVKGYQRKIT